MRQDSLDVEFLSGLGCIAVVFVGVCLYFAPMGLVAFDLLGGILIAAAMGRRGPEAVSIAARPQPRRQKTYRKAE